MAEHPVARVLPESRLPQLDRLFDYAIPEGMDIRPGVRVKVPMGKGGRLVSGFVVELAGQSDFTGTLAAIDTVVSPVSVLTPEIYELAGTIARRGAGGTSDVLRLAIPPRAVRVEKQWLERGDTPVEPAVTPPPPGEYSSESWEALVEPGAKHWVQKRYGVTSQGPESWPHGLDDLARIATTVLASQRSVIICVPDWRDVELLERSLLSLVEPDHLARFDPGHTPSERYRNYLRTLEDRPVIAYGSRHVLYAPVSRLGALLVDTDSDSSHKEPLAPYPHSRDIALLRAEQTGASVGFSSHLPSLEVTRLMAMGYLAAVRPIRDERPRVIPTALGRTDQSANAPARLPSLAFQAVKKALESGPVLVQVFHAGYSAGLACVECRERARCGDCGGPLRQLGRGESASCAWCGHLASDWVCPDCHHRSLTPVGQGIGRTTGELGKAFPGVPVVQSDGQHRLLEVAHKPALVVATRGAEPIVPGGYRTALLLDGEAMLQRPALDAQVDTLTAWEAALSLLAPNAVAYLTDLDGPIAQAVASDAMEKLLVAELAERQALRMPPAIRVASLRGPQGLVEQLTATLTPQAEVDALGPVSVNGEARALIRMPYREAGSIAGELRAAVVRQATESGRLQSRLKVAMDDLATLDELATGDL